MQGSSQLIEGKLRAKWNFRTCLWGFPYKSYLLGEVMWYFRGHYPTKRGWLLPHSWECHSKQSIVIEDFNLPLLGCHLRKKKKPRCPQPILHSLQCLLLQLHGQSVDKCIPGVPTIGWKLENRTSRTRVSSTIQYPMVLYSRTTITCEDEFVICIYIYYTSCSKLFYIYHKMSLGMHISGHLHWHLKGFSAFVEMAFPIETSTTGLKICQ